VCWTNWVKKVLSFGWKFFPLSKNIGLVTHPVKLYGVASGPSIRRLWGLILMKIVFNCFNFYSIGIDVLQD
jgi:hypothetical protein